MTHTGPGHATAAGPDKARCYQQLDNDNGVGVVSQSFETPYAAYDSRGADDFTLNANCQVKQIEVKGSYISGSGPVASANVTIYRDLNGKPAGITTNQAKLKVVDDGNGDLTISLRSGTGLVPGTYWLSVQVNMDYGSGNEWGWNTNDSVRGTAADWRNVDNGFDTGCIHYTLMSTCIAAGQGGDFAFAIDGK